MTRLIWNWRLFRAVLTQHQVSCLWLTAALFNTIIDQEAEVLGGFATS